MTSSVVLGRHWTLETVQVEQQVGLDGQGKPTYDTPVDIEAHVTWEDRVVVERGGTFTRTALTVYVPADAAVLPVRYDRLTYDGNVVHVLQVKDVKNRQAQLIYRRLRTTQEVV